MAQVYLQKGGRTRLVEETRVPYWEKQGFKKIPELNKAKPKTTKKKPDNQEIKKDKPQD